VRHINHDINGQRLWRLLQMVSERHPREGCAALLSTAQLQLKYLAEGAANVIYTVQVLGPEELQRHDHCCVLRMRKALPFTKPCTEAMEDFENCIQPLFSHHPSLLMKQALYKLTREMVMEADQELRDLDHHHHHSSSKGNKGRDHHRRHVYLPSYEEEQYGILMPNLQKPGTDRLIEFKPKWLVQSPSAPQDARRCRTCALNAMRRHSAKTKGRGDSGFCPLDLLSEDDRVMEKAVAHIWRPMDQGLLDVFAREFRTKVQPALRHLQLLQLEHSFVGLDHFRDPGALDFSIAMALRDCSAFLVIDQPSRSGKEDVEITDVKFADLDLKSPDGGKVEKWAAMEEELIRGHWYLAAGESDETCALGRGHG